MIKKFTRDNVLPLWSLEKGVGLAISKLVTNNTYGINADMKSGARISRQSTAFNTLDQRSQTKDQDQKCFPEDKRCEDKTLPYLEWQKRYTQLEDQTDALIGHLNITPACESWILTAELESRIQETEMRCYRRLLCILYKEKPHHKCWGTEQSHKSRGIHEYLLTKVKRWKLKWYGHVTRSTRLTKTILQELYKGKRKKGRQRKRWKINTEWTGNALSDNRRRVEDREKWRELVARYSDATTVVSTTG